MSARENFPDNSTPDIPDGLLDSLPTHEQWLYRRCWSNEKKADWLIEHAKRADDHRTEINRVVAELDAKVVPAVNLANRFSTVKGKAYAAGVGFVTIAITVALTEWFKSLWK